jgi:hypothetical protein
MPVGPVVSELSLDACAGMFIGFHASYSLLDGLPLNGQKLSLHKMTFQRDPIHVLL